MALEDLHIERKRISLGDVIMEGRFLIIITLLFRFVILKYGETYSKFTNNPTICDVTGQK